jgi:hypothetical protein
MSIKNLSLAMAQAYSPTWEAEAGGSFEPSLSNTVRSCLKKNFFR